tara:strand:- start:3016 stop:3342 length:327 start_codon:yes stop_codon:yes gene_type:complete
MVIKRNKALKTIAEENYLDTDDENLARLDRLVLEEVDIFENDFDISESEILKTLDVDEFDGLAGASWKTQMLRGQFAKKLGYRAVSTTDEHGESYLILPGPLSNAPRR